MAPWLRSLLALMLLACAPSDPPASGPPSPSLVAAGGVDVQQRDARPSAAPGGAELGVEGDVDGDGFAPPTDCDDGDPSRYPGATEVIGDEIDQDCDGVERCYLDFDNDGHRPDAVTWQFSLDGDCADGAEARRDEPTDDCNDRSASIHPGASEITANGVDETCDGVEVCFADLDNDGYRTLPVTYRNSSDLDCLDNTEAVVTDPTGDCNDNAASVRPNATEIVGNNVDENCDGAELCFRDNDNDGYRTTSTTSIPSADADCDDNGEGRSTDPTTDCNDNAAETNPGATEIVGDGIDQTCDGRETCYNDGDDDGYRPPILFLRSSTDLDCNDPLEARASDPATDCDDTRAWVRPGLAESTGDGVDVNCDGAELCWLDADGDGHRPDAVSTAAPADTDCADLGEALSSAPIDDCDDADGARFPGAAERDGEGADLDCDGQITCFIDGDGDGWHAGLLSTIPWAPFACDAPGLVGLSGQEGDCDDADASVHPGAFDPPDDGVDQSCAGGFLCFADADGDGFRSEGMTLSTDLDCLDPGEAGAAAPLDCDDARADVYAGAPEVVGDLVDQDCDGTERCFADLDGDGARPTAQAAAVTGAEVASSDADCDDPGEAGPAAPEADCNDLDAAIGPGAPESPGDNLDADCDGGELCWLDEDDDGYLGASGALVVSADGDCADPFEAGVGALAGDCDDRAPSVWPGAVDATGDGVDSDCDGRERCFVDADGDGWRLGPAATVVSADVDCADPGEALLSAPATDCADTDPMVYPNAVERVADEIDQDCDARELCLVDADADGFRVDDGATVLSADRDCRDPGEALPTTPIGDCDDTRSGFRPGALEVVADGFDSDCDGLELCRVDADGDGQRPPGDATVASADGDCVDAGEASVHAPPTDCDDLDASVRVGADERPVDGVDQDCDGGEACYADADDDGWRALGEVRSADLDCDDAGEAVASDPFGDCDDADPARSPSAVEQPGDGIDQDCDGLELCFVDDDRDGWRPLIDRIEASPRLGCDAGDLASDAAPVGDCDDSRGDVRPGAVEGPADLVDSDCDGLELCWVDADGDGNHAGQTRPADLLCTEPGVVGAFALGGDCDDLDARRYVGAVDPGGDGGDQDCAGDARCGADGDGDGARAQEIESGDPDCLDPGELPLDAAADCDDADPARAPGLPEVDADGVDADCDGVERCFVDADGDGWRTDALVDAAHGCAGYAHASAPSGDCDDASAAVHPTAVEVPGDGVDADCVENAECQVDRDGDGFADPAAPWLLSADADCEDPGEAPADAGPDCDDASPAVFPGAVEPPGAGVDLDCDGLVACFADGDGDGAHAGASVVALGDCAGLLTAADPGGDCDDADPLRRPGLAEAVADGVDNDCDGVERCFVDGDGDGWRTGAVIGGDADCGDPGEALASAPAFDCDDFDARRNPGLAEVVGDGVDQDCDYAEDCYVDLDGDGWRTDRVTGSDDLDCTGPAEATRFEPAGDCDDQDFTRNPGQAELPGDERDTDCDGVERCWADLDRDGFRAEVLAPVDGDVYCRGEGEAAPGAPAGDCDDADAAVRPGVVDAVADGRDADCDGYERCWVDADGDGWRTDAVALDRALDCAAPGVAGADAGAVDCDDGDASVFPGAADPDGLGLDCGAQIRCRVDRDGDGAAGPGFVDSPDDDCADPGEAAADAPADCDDAAPDRAPGLVDLVGDGVDADCDGVEWCFVDADADGVATEDVAPSAVGDCLGAGEALAGAPRGDCDDADPARFPGGLEQVADGRDNDCDGVERCFVDADGDGWTSPDPLARVDSADADCFDPGESTGALRGDCDDADPGANPGAVEVVGDGVDQDCLPAVYCRVDADGDGFGGAALIEAVDPACPGALPPTADATDCDDARADVWPGAVEVEGDGVDQDCAPGSRCGVDGDGDGALGAVIVLEVPGCAGLAPDGPITDCDDANPARRPGALELAGDGVDADCDGADLCFVDLDGDGWRTDAIVEVDGGCGVGGYVLAGLPPGDCDDGDAAVSPGADEGAGDGVDQNCDGDERCFSDEDEDGWRGEAERVSLDADCEDLGEAGLAMPAGDCDDGDATVFPGADDPPADGVDQACDGGFTCFLDGDGDGWRLEVSVASADEDCDDAGEADGDAPAGDCDDADDRVHPGAAEVAGDGADADCDGGELCFVDVDGDGWRVEDTVWVDGTACVGSGLAADDAGAGDCDDADASVLPGADEAGVFGADVDCDGRMACFVDADEDGWRTEEIVLAPSCSDPGFAVLDDLAPDCDDLDPDRGADCATAPVEEPEGCGCRVEGGGGGAWAWGLPLLWRMRRRGPEKARSNR